jgi:hypothetical protein
VVIDQTKGVMVDEGGSISVQTIQPAADVRRSAIVSLGIVFDDLIDAEIEFGSTVWRIKTVVENGFELRLILIEDD